MHRIRGRPRRPPAPRTRRSAARSAASPTASAPRCRTPPSWSRPTRDDPEQQRQRAQRHGGQPVHEGLQRRREALVEDVDADVAAAGDRQREADRRADGQRVAAELGGTLDEKLNALRARFPPSPATTGRGRPRRTGWPAGVRASASWQMVTSRRPRRRRSSSTPRCSPWPSSRRLRSRSAARRRASRHAPSPRRPGSPAPRPA